MALNRMSRAAGISAAISLYLRPQVLIVALLGFSAGLPLALSGATLAVWMADRGADVQTIGYATHIVARCDLAEDVVYKILKGMVDNKADLAAIAKAMAGNTPKTMAEDVGVPICMSATGPKNLRAAGSLADRVMLYVGVNPVSVNWAMDHVRAGAEEAGRDPDDLKFSILTAMWVFDDQEEAWMQCRWATAACANHPRPTTA